jgi:hypothetical protein
MPFKDLAAEPHSIAKALRTTRSTCALNAVYGWIGFSEHDGKDFAEGAVFCRDA